MHRPASPVLWLRTAAACFLAMGPALSPADEVAKDPARFVSYEDFGAKGDGTTDDLPAIVAAHDRANELGLPVRSGPDATYHLGSRALTAVIQTDTDWNTSRFIIDDSQGVEDHKRPLFEVRSRLAPEPLAIERLARGQTRLEARPGRDLLVLVENKERQLFIRRGLNRNDGTPQREVFILRRDGSIEGAIDWDYETVTRVEARPIDPEQLVLRGGVFHHIANNMRQDAGYNYWARNIEISRSNTEVDGISLTITGEGEFGHPYNGFLRARQAADITFRNCRLEGRKVYTTIGAAGAPVKMGTYSYRADLVVNFRMLDCRMDETAIHDTTRWGVIATNFMKNVLLEDCVLSRMDVHQGVSGGYVIRRTILGHQGLQAIGRGLLLVEDSTIHSRSLISFRTDYGSTWDGDVVVRNSRWAPPRGGGGRPVMFAAGNDGTHDFGYPCSLPETIRIDGLFVDDAWTRDSKTPGVAFFGDILGEPRENRPFPYQLTKRVEVSGLTAASGIAPVVSSNPDVETAVSVALRP